MTASQFVVRAACVYAKQFADCMCIHIWHMESSIDKAGWTQEACAGRKRPCPFTLLVHICSALLPSKRHNDA